MPNRNRNRLIMLNETDQYREKFKERGVNHIRHYSTKTLKYPTAEEIRLLSITHHVWSQGDRLYKLAYKYYGDSTLWWVIAWYNKKPTDAHYSLGELVSVPKPLEVMFSLLGV
jgi:nucleoid-associated protein YgaU